MNCWSLCTRPPTFSAVPAPVDNLSASIIYDRLNLRWHMSFMRWLLFVDELDAVLIQFRAENPPKAPASPKI